MKKDLRIVFMGTPAFAVATLGSLLMNGFNVVGVVTSPDKPSGRGRKMSGSAVKVFAIESNLLVLQPENLKDPDFINMLKGLKPDIFIVVAFRMLPEIVWRLPSSGTINLHASLLPHYRGAAPVNHVIINGESVTGVTTFFIDDKIDTGNILLQEEIPVYPNENAGDLHDRLMKAGAVLVVRTLEALTENRIKPVPQSQLLSNGQTPKTAPKIFLKDCIINWNQDHLVIHNFVRGLSPYPCARSYFVKDSVTFLFKIFESQSEHGDHSLKPGEIISDGKSFLKIACRTGFLNILSLQIEDRKKMTTAEFLRGTKISDYRITANQQVS